MKFKSMKMEGINFIRKFTRGMEIISFCFHCNKFFKCIPLI
jgi:hypothetical protein